MVYCSATGPVAVRFASFINFIKLIDEVEGVDIDALTTIASFWELIFACENGVGDDGFCKQAFKVLGIVRNENIQ
jgi:hypothetical protein